MNLRKLRVLSLQYFFLSLLWVVLSGKFEAKYLLIGALSAGLVTFFSRDLLHPRGIRRQKKPAGLRELVLSAWHAFLYVGWLLGSIVGANLQVAYLVLHPRMPIQPGMLQFKTRLRSNFGRVVLANSITLTPGTITVDLRSGTYLVHALVPAAAQSLLDAKMQNKLEVIFQEREEPMLPVRWLDGTEGYEP